MQTQPQAFLVLLPSVLLCEAYPEPEVIDTEGEAIDEEDGEA